MTSFGEREITKEPVWCEYCCHLDEIFVQYVQGGAVYCPHCVYANDGIDDGQLLDDEEDSLDGAINYYEQKVRKLKAKRLRK